MEVISFIATITSLISFFGSIWDFIDNAQGFDENFDGICERLDEQAARFEGLSNGIESHFGFSPQRTGRSVVLDQIRATIRDLRKVYGNIRSCGNTITMQVKLRQKRNHITRLEKRLDSCVKDLQTSLGIMNLYDPLLHV